MWAPMRSLPWQNCKNWTPFCSGEKIFNFSTRDPDHLHALASRAYGAIFSKNSFFGTTHGDKPTSQNGISLRSPSLIMAPVVLLKTIQKNIARFVFQGWPGDDLRTAICWVWYNG